MFSDLLIKANKTEGYSNFLRGTHEFDVQVTVYRYKFLQ